MPDPESKTAAGHFLKDWLVNNLAMASNVELILLPVFPIPPTMAIVIIAVALSPFVITLLAEDMWEGKI